MHETIVIDDLEQESRWPDRSDTALELGVRSSISFRLFLETSSEREDTMGVLHAYAPVPGAFGARSQMVGQVFASHAAVALKAAMTKTGPEQALAARDVIGEAKCILMERQHLPAAEAFDRLRERSMKQGIRMRDLAEHLVNTGGASAQSEPLVAGNAPLRISTRPGRTRGCSNRGGPRWAHYCY